MPQAVPELTADELAWLATLDDVESRLILTDKVDGGPRYRVDHGPFDEQMFSKLPADNWTLVVQDVEKHLPVLRKLLCAAQFIPDWRVDDLMVSYAVPGGSVGPHRDNYDVFLCQGSGCREWRIAERDAELASVESGELSLLEPFVDPNPIRARPCDVLYLPPGLAHWGIALEPCMTYSVGMRAPALSDITAATARILGVDMEVRDSEQLYYADPDLEVGEADPGRISRRAIRRARRCFSSAIDLEEDDFAIVFGCVVTEVKPWLAPETPSESEVDEFLHSGNSDIAVHGMARLAYFRGVGRNFVFANGFVKTASAEELDLVRRICSDRTAQAAESELFKWLADKGVFDVLPGERNDAT